MEKFEKTGNFDITTLVGARFEALDESILTPPSVSSSICFTIQTLLSLCDHRELAGVSEKGTISDGGGWYGQPKSTSVALFLFSCPVERSGENILCSA